jgi:hypothetical protein
VSFFAHFWRDLIADRTVQQYPDGELRHETRHFAEEIGSASQTKPQMKAIVARFPSARDGGTPMIRFKLTRWWSAFLRNGEPR